METEEHLDTRFWNNLILGRKYEEEVAQWFESLGFSVWRMGNFRLPIDLYVWDSKKDFFIEVKFRTQSEAHLNILGLKEFLSGKRNVFIKGKDRYCFGGKIIIPIFLITIFPKGSTVKRLEKQRFNGHSILTEQHQRTKGYKNFSWRGI